MSLLFDGLHMSFDCLSLPLNLLTTTLMTFVFRFCSANGNGELGNQLISQGFGVRMLSLREMLR